MGILWWRRRPLMPPHLTLLSPSERGGGHPVCGHLVAESGEDSIPPASRGRWDVAQGRQALQKMEEGGEEGQWWRRRRGGYGMWPRDARPCSRGIKTGGVEQVEVVTGCGPGMPGPAVGE